MADENLCECGAVRAECARVYKVAGIRCPGGLSQKGLAGFQQDADGDICWITAAGFDALVAAGLATK